MQHLQPWGSLPASHTHARPRWQKCSVHTFSSVEQPSPQMHHLRAVWSPSSDQVHREAWSDAPRSPTKGTLGDVSRRTHLPETPLPGDITDKDRQQTDSTNREVKKRTKPKQQEDHMQGTGNSAGGTNEQNSNVRKDRVWQEELLIY